MKIGDKLLCKESYSSNNTYWVIKGKFYEINFIYDNSIELIDEGGIYSLINFDLYDKKEKHYSYLYDYFYTNVEMRQLKLNTL